MLNSQHLQLQAFFLFVLRYLTWWTPYFQKKKCFSLSETYFIGSKPKLFTKKKPQSKHQHINTFVFKRAYVFYKRVVGRPHFVLLSATYLFFIRSIPNNKKNIDFSNYLRVYYKRRQLHVKWSMWLNYLIELTWT